MDCMPRTSRLFPLALSPPLLTHTNAHHPSPVPWSPSHTKTTQVANWTFKFADTPDEESPLRRGFFTVFPSMEAYNQQSEGITKVNDGV